MKKQLWFDNTPPPDNHIWVKTDLNNNIIGLFVNENGKWKKKDSVVSKEDLEDYVKKEDAVTSEDLNSVSKVYRVDNPFPGMPPSDTTSLKEGDILIQNEVVIGELSIEQNVNYLAVGGNIYLKAIARSNWTADIGYDNTFSTLKVYRTVNNNETLVGTITNSGSSIVINGIAIIPGMNYAGVEIPTLGALQNNTFSLRSDNDGELELTDYIDFILYYPEVCYERCGNSVMQRKDNTAQVVPGGAYDSDTGTLNTSMLYMSIGSVYNSKKVGKPVIVQIADTGNNYYADVIYSLPSEFGFIFKGKLYKVTQSSVTEKDLFV